MVMMVMTMVKMVVVVTIRLEIYLHWVRAGCSARCRTDGLAPGSAPVKSSEKNYSLKN